MSREIELPIHVTDFQPHYDPNKKLLVQDGWDFDGLIDLGGVLEFDIHNRGIDSDVSPAFIDSLRISFHADKIAQDQIMRLAFPDKDKPIFMVKVKIPEK